MINNLDGKSAKELREIVQIQMDEYQNLQQANDEAQLLIGLLEAKVEKCEQDRDERDIMQQVKGVENFRGTKGFWEFSNCAFRTFTQEYEERLRQRAKQIILYLWRQTAKKAAKSKLKMRN